MYNRNNFGCGHLRIPLQTMVTVPWVLSLSPSGLLSSVSNRFLLSISLGHFEMEAICSNETSVCLWTTRHDKPEVHSYSSGLHQNFRSSPVSFSGAHNEAPRLGGPNYLSLCSIRPCLCNRAAPSLLGDRYKLTWTYEFESAVQHWMQKALLMRSEGFMTPYSLVGSARSHESSIGIVATDKELWWNFSHE